MSLTAPLPLPATEKNDEKRLWIGNLDSRITEYHLLKILQKYGEIEKFDLLYHKSGPQAGQPRGYAFVTFLELANADRFRFEMHGKRLGHKTLSIKWAHTVDNNELTKTKMEISIPALGVRDEKKVNRESQIQAIESKLKMMELVPVEEFQISNQPSTSSSSILNIYNKKPQLKHQSRMRTGYRETRRSMRPYFMK